MTATEELRRMLDERGGEYFKHEDGEPLRKLEKADEPATSWRLGNASVCAVPIEGSDLFDLWIDHCTPEQAIAATLGSELPYDELLRCLENDWNISASWDGLRKFWCIELTEEGVKLRNSAHVTLTAEQVMGIAGKHQPDYCSDTHVCFDWQAIADELNATLGSGTCKVESMHGYTDARTHTSWCVELSCHTLDAWEDSIPPSYCPICGARVVE